MIGGNIRNLAIIIDADNTRFSIVNLLLAEIAKSVSRVGRTNCFSN